MGRNQYCCIFNILVVKILIEAGSNVHAKNKVVILITKKGAGDGSIEDISVRIIS